jgi:hypothetical protein
MAEYLPWHQGGSQLVRINLFGATLTFINTNEVQNLESQKCQIHGLSPSLEPRRLTTQKD